MMSLVDTVTGVLQIHCGAAIVTRFRELGQSAPTALVPCPAGLWVPDVPEASCCRCQMVLLSVAVAAAAAVVVVVDLAAASGRSQLEPADASGHRLTWSSRLVG
ncbi:hypothetical protein CIHG_05286 [Coccidioides immitis H538.4]|uniref:Uncharacterized protein n=2 Tax=Coccidioides immitis TaxID=5501 RepID=A0A0J8RQV8_COCIT|nr:hypothetical protein CIRG_08353 [Coccidioides immitis RMSCC 2394]KMU87490.1 hypothetical protein CIHG_05286 [Coccidioides immitis H538.4]